LHWKVYARNKKSLALNLRAQAGRDALLDLLASSHVLIENYRPGTLEEMGLGPDVLHARNPRLIIVRITGFGQDGPYRDRPGFGTLVEAMTGFASKNGYGHRPPVLPPLALAEMIDDPRFRTNTDRVRNIDECDGAVAAFIAQRTLDENMAVFQAAEVTATPVYEIDQLVADEHIRARGVVVEAPDEEAGSVLMH